MSLFDGTAELPPRACLPLPAWEAYASKPGLANSMWAAAIFSTVLFALLFLVAFRSARKAASLPAYTETSPPAS